MIHVKVCLQSVYCGLLVVVLNFQLIELNWQPKILKIVKYHRFFKLAFSLDLDIIFPFPIPVPCPWLKPFYPYKDILYGMT